MDVKKKAGLIGAALVVLIVIVGIIGGVKGAQIAAMIEGGESFVPPPIAVTTDEVVSDEWDVTISAIGTAVAVQATDIASEVPGAVRSLRIESGQQVEAGQILFTLGSTVERAQLRAARADAELAGLTLGRSERLGAQGAVPNAELDGARARQAASAANVSLLQATIAKKTIRAPFAGRLGICDVDLGQIVQPGTPLISLQRITPLYVDFQVPASQLAQLTRGLVVRIRSDSYPDEHFEGAVETIDTQVDASTRNVRVRATLANEDERLRPGMFLEVRVVQPQSRDVVIVPNTAILYAPYGDSVYVVDESEGSVVGRQVFVRVGERRGDFVEVLSGVEDGQTVVATGAFKLQNGAALSVQNDVAPPDPQTMPTPENRK
ncbi:MAG: membrane fusion protein (multidrug efflux system) [Polyangiales bacterium]